jgi:hypothetical protein
MRGTPVRRHRLRDGGARETQHRDNQESLHSGERIAPNEARRRAEIECGVSLQSDAMQAGLFARKSRVWLKWPDSTLLVPRYFRCLEKPVFTTKAPGRKGRERVDLFENLGFAVMPKFRAQ